jgi:hypothetical protein
MWSGERRKPAIIHAESQLVVVLTPRHVINEVDLALFVGRVLALGINSGTVYV